MTTHWVTVLDPDGIDGNADDSDGYVDGVDGKHQVLSQTKRANNGVVVTAPNLCLPTDYKNKQIKESPLVTLAFFMTNKYVCSN